MGPTFEVFHISGKISKIAGISTILAQSQPKIWDIQQHCQQIFCHHVVHSRLCIENMHRYLICHLIETLANWIAMAFTGSLLHMQLDWLWVAHMYIHTYVCYMVRNFQYVQRPDYTLSSDVGWILVRLLDLLGLPTVFQRAVMEYCPLMQ